MSATNTCGTPIPEPPTHISIKHSALLEKGCLPESEIVKIVMERYYIELDHWRHEHLFKQKTEPTP